MFSYLFQQESFLQAPLLQNSPRTLGPCTLYLQPSQKGSWRWSNNSRSPNLNSGSPDQLGKKQFCIQRVFLENIAHEGDSMSLLDLCSSCHTRLPNQEHETDLLKRIHYFKRRKRVLLILVAHHETEEVHKDFQA